MAEVTAFRNNALPYPIYGQQYTITFPMLDADGDLVTGATTPGAERSLNGDTFADCTNESTEIATNSGMYYLTLTAAEMTADIVTVIAKSATAGMKTTAITLYPRKLVTVRTGTAADDGSGTADVVLDSGASAVDDYYNGCVVCVVIDGAASAECRVVTDYTGSTKTATVAVGFNTAVDNTDTFTMYLPEGALHGDMLYGDKIYSDTTHIDSDCTADQIILSDVQSDTNALMVKVGEADFSDILSAATIIKSQVLILKSDVSDVLSAITVVKSDVISNALILSDANSGINALQVAIPASEGDISDILSRLTVTNSNVLIIKSDVSDVLSAATIIKSDVISNALILSDANSGINAIQAAGGALTSDQDSKLTIIATNVLATGTLFELVSDIYSDTTAIEAQAGASLTSDQDSKLTAIATTVLVGGTLFELASDIYSDTTHIDSDVTLNESRVLVVKSDVSDVLSAVTIIKSDQISNALIISDIQSDTNAMVTTLSDVQSDTNALLVKLGEGDWSDILSRLVVTNSQLVVVKSDVAHIESDAVVIEAIVSDIQSDTSDIQSKLVVQKAETVKIYSDTTAVETKTSGLTYTVANTVDANVQAVNDVTVTGTGALGDEWGQ